MFDGCTDLNSVSIPESVTSIGNRAFYGCTSLTSVTIPSSVTSISEEAFRGCTNLTTLIIPNSVANVGNNALEGTAWYNNQLDGLVYVGKVAYKYKGEIPDGTHITIAEGTLDIANGAFYGCTGFASVTIPSSVINIGGNAFQCFYGLTSVIIPNSVTKIGINAFRSCTNLNSVTIPCSVMSVEEDAFRGCSGLTSVSIDGNLTKIGSGAFYGCSDLITVTVNMETPLSLLYNPFSNYANATLYVPAGCKNVYEEADYWKDFKEIIEMADNITIGTTGMGTYCSSFPLDFSGTNDIKAYIVSAFKPSTGEVIMTRIPEVPANTGIVVKGNAGTYTVPYGAGELFVANMLVGVTDNTVLNKVDGEYTNYILANKNSNLGFYAVEDGSTLSANKAYLPLLTASLPINAGARQMKLVFDDDEDITTNIKSSINDGEANEIYYDLQGRRVVNPTSGLYVVRSFQGRLQGKNGKKVIVR